MDEELEQFLARLGPRTQEEIVWPNGLSFSLTSYLTDAEPPAALLTSARAVVLQGGKVLVVRDPSNIHITPGGRIEAGESPRQTACREVLEETGWHVDLLSQIGLRHFHHLQPVPKDYVYLYPDFIQIVFAAQAVSFDASGREVNGYELDSGFLTIIEASALDLSAGERLFLEAAEAISRHGQIRQE